MSIFAGIVSRQPGVAPAPEYIAQLRAHLSRQPQDQQQLRELRGADCYIVGLELGALGGSGHWAGPGVQALVAGVPLLQREPAAAPLERDASLAALAQALAAGVADPLLAGCRGTYCAVVLEAGGRLHLVTDKCGVRPIYCWVRPDCIVFATALRVLEALGCGTGELSLQGVAEAACFGYSLADRTAYLDVLCLHAGEVLTVDAGAVRRHRYWHWDALAPRRADGGSAAARLYRSFRDAVRVRRGADTSVAAFLSGGLDSRAIVAALREDGAAVASSNYAPAGSQDQELGAQAAACLGAEHTRLAHRPFAEGDPYSKGSVLDWLRAARTSAGALSRPQVIWSGDGGSVCVGNVYLNAAMYQALRAGNAAQALALFRDYNRCHLSVRLLRRGLRGKLAQLVDAGMRAELDALTPPDPARKLFLFLLLNDQRRHLFHHFETLDQTRVEFELPFFDAVFLADILAEPADIFLRHQFYLDWLACFELGVLSVAWQAYPGHQPCPLPVPPDLSYQWSQASAADLRKDARRLLADARALLATPGFAPTFLSRGRLYGFMLAMLTGRGRLAYHLKLPRLLHRYWLRRSGMSDAAT